MFKHTRMTFLVFALGILLSFSTIALATSVYSDWKYFGPTNGEYYQNRASATSSPGSVNGTAVIQTQDLATVPTGWMGISSYLYNSSGVCVANSSWYYNPSASIGIGQTTPTVTTPGYYYCKGLSQAYNGNGYDSYWTYQTPNIGI